MKVKKPNLSITGNISKPIGDNTTVSANPITQTAGISKPDVANVGDVSIGGSLGVGAGGVGVTPRIQVGDSPGASSGASAGQTVGSLGGSLLGPAGAVVGAGVGSAAGSLLGDAFGGDSRVQKETKARDGLFSSFEEAGIFQDGKIELPDGHVWDRNNGPEHSWKYPDKRVNNIGDRQLFSYETDYTNDLDYLSSMAGITLSRLVAGGKGKPVDQVGNALGNAFLGKIGYGADLSKENFAQVNTNTKAGFSRAGIKTKDDLLAVANAAYADGRINDSDYAVAQQVAGVVFDDNFSLAQQLMAGRWDGLKTAAKTPTDQTVNQENKPGRIYSPIISPQEALLSVKPFFDYYKDTYPGAQRKPSSLREGISTGIQILGGATALGGLYNSVNKLTDGGLGNFITGVKDDLRGVYDDLFNTEDTTGGLSDNDLNLGGGSGDASFADSPVEPELEDSGSFFSNWF